MYYEFSEFYKRETSFVYNQEKNPVNWLELWAGKSFHLDTPLIFDVDKIDSYINKFDVLPTIGIPLVSNIFKSLFVDLVESKEIEFYAASIIDKKGNINNSFWGLNILNIVSCLDEETSIFDVDEDGYYSIKKWFIRPSSLEQYSIVRMSEHKSYIIITDVFKNRCEEAGLKGINFREEGHSIFKDL